MPDQIPLEDSSRNWTPGQMPSEDTSRNWIPDQIPVEDHPQTGIPQARAPPSNKKSSMLAPGKRRPVSLSLLSLF